MRVGIVGVSGYTGLELLKTLLKHQNFKINYLANTQGGIKISQIHKSLESICDLQVKAFDSKEAIEKCDLIFLALPHKSAMQSAKEILDKNNKMKIIDLSADYRLDKKRYELNYCPHIDEENLKKAVYGLVEYNRKKIAKANLIANPGCYPTATLLGLLPFVKYFDKNSAIFVDAKSGVSGAGKTLSENTHYPRINENLFSYNPLSHRHQVEIEYQCELISNFKREINFVPHLTPLTRGMLVSIYATLEKPLDSKQAFEILQNQYKNEKFIRLRETPVEIGDVVNSNFCDIFVKTRNNSIFINTAIDNLSRGASTQAVVNANIMCGFAESMGVL